MGQSMEESSKKMEEQVITLEKWEKERDALVASVGPSFSFQTSIDLSISCRKQKWMRDITNKALNLTRGAKKKRSP